MTKATNPDEGAGESPPAESGVRIVGQGPEQDTLGGDAAHPATGQYPAASPALARIDLAPLRALYDGATETAVVAFLATHPELIGVLVESAPRLRAVFGGHARLCLEAPLLTVGPLAVRVYGHGLAPVVAAAREEAFLAWWVLAYEQTSAARRWLDVSAGAGVARRA